MREDSLDFFTSFSVFLFSGASDASFFYFFLSSQSMLLLVGFFILAHPKKKKRKRKKRPDFFERKKGQSQNQGKRGTLSFAPLSYTEREKRTTTTVLLQQTVLKRVLVAEL